LHLRIFEQPKKNSFFSNLIEQAVAGSILSESRLLTGDSKACTQTFPAYPGFLAHWMIAGSSFSSKTTPPSTISTTLPVLLRSIPNAFFALSEK